MLKDKNLPHGDLGKRLNVERPLVSPTWIVMTQRG